MWTSKVLEGQQQYIFFYLYVDWTHDFCSANPMLNQTLYSMCGLSELLRPIHTKNDNYKNEV